MGNFLEFTGISRLPGSVPDYFDAVKEAFMTLLGMGPGPLVLWFFMFSFLGYIMECIVLSLENHTLVTNRGFCHLPVCVIYGFTAIVGVAFMMPLTPSPLVIFIVSVVLATFAEYMTAIVMIKLFGAFWWDYSNKRFNYKGILCLESSIGWGIVGLVFFYFLHDVLIKASNLLPDGVSVVIACLLIVTYLSDFIYCSYRRHKGLDDDTNGIGRTKVTQE